MYFTLIQIVSRHHFCLNQTDCKLHQSVDELYKIDALHRIKSKHEGRWRCRPYHLCLWVCSSILAENWMEPGWYSPCRDSRACGTPRPPFRHLRELHWLGSLSAAGNCGSTDMNVVFRGLPPSVDGLVMACKTSAQLWQCRFPRNAPLLSEF